MRSKLLSTAPKIRIFEVENSRDNAQAKQQDKKDNSQLLETVRDQVNQLQNNI